MRLGIMQPYFLPYIGYFQLIAAVDIFVVYDNIKYTKKGWINRNRMLLNGTATVFSLPLKKGSDSHFVVERELASDFNRDKLLNQFKGAYSNAPYFDQTFPVLKEIVRNSENNLFRYIYGSILDVCTYLGIKTSIQISSQIAVEAQLKGLEKVLALCAATKANTYINTIGGLELYARENFRARGIELSFIKSRPLEYPQFGNPFVPWLSIVDVLMFNPRDAVRECVLQSYDLI